MMLKISTPVESTSRLYCTLPGTRLIGNDLGVCYGTKLIIRVWIELSVHAHTHIHTYISELCEHAFFRCTYTHNSNGCAAPSVIASQYFTIMCVCVSVAMCI